METSRREAPIKRAHRIGAATPEVLVATETLESHTAVGMVVANSQTGMQTTRSLTEALADRTPITIVIAIKKIQADLTSLRSGA